MLGDKCAYCGESGRTLCGKPACLAREDMSTRAGRRNYRKRMGLQTQEDIPVAAVLKASLKFTSLNDIAAYNPSAKVRLHFRNHAGQEGTYECTARYATNTGPSRVIMPQANETPDDLGWPTPYWFAEDIKRVDILDLQARPATRMYDSNLVTKKG